MLRIAVIVGSTRPGRNGEAVAKWVHAIASSRGDATYELVDIEDQGLPLLDEPIPPSQDKYQNQHTKDWAATIAPFDAFVFVTPEYNHGTSGALKNALDYLYKEWNDKAAGFVAYGSAGGARAVEQLRLNCAELQIATVREQVALMLHDDFEHYTSFKPRAHQEKALHRMLDQLLPWATAMQGVRAAKQKGESGHEGERPPRPAQDASRAGHRKDQKGETSTATPRSKDDGRTAKA